VRSLLDALGRDAGALASENLTTESLPALRHFLEGERLFRTAQFAESVRSYELALAEDSTFVLAMARVSDAYGWLENVGSDEGLRWGTEALEHVDELPPRLALYVRANDALINGSAAMLPDLRAAVGRYPDDPEAWFLLAETIFHLPGPAMVPIEEAARAFEEAVALDPGFTPYLQHVADMAIMMGDREKAQAALDRYRSVAGPDAETFIAHAAIGIPLVLGTDEEAAQAVAEARDADARTLGLLLLTYATRTDRFDRFEQVRAHMARSGAAIQNREILLSMGARGAFSGAATFADSATLGDLGRVLYMGHIANLWEASPEAEVFRSRLDPATCENNVGCSVFLAFALAQSGRWDDVDAVLSRIRDFADQRMEEAGDSDFQIFADVAEGRTAVFRGDATRARQLLDPWKGSFSIWGQVARAGLAELARREGRWTAATALYTGLLGDLSRPLGLYGLAKAAEARGDDDEARRYWRSFVTLTTGGDPERVPRIQEGREALARLGGPVD
jgi:tetratricopeptide (TPR) repeat protein